MSGLGFNKELRNGTSSLPVRSRSNTVTARTPPFNTTSTTSGNSASLPSRNTFGSNVPLLHSKATNAMAVPRKVGQTNNTVPGPITLSSAALGKAELLEQRKQLLLARNEQLKLIESKKNYDLVNTTEDNNSIKPPKVWLPPSKPVTSEVSIPSVVPVVTNPILAGITLDQVQEEVKSQLTALGAEAKTLRDVFDLKKTVEETRQALKALDSQMHIVTLRLEAVQDHLDYYKLLDNSLAIVQEQIQGLLDLASKVTESEKTLEEMQNDIYWYRGQVLWDNVPVFKDRELTDRSSMQLHNQQQVLLVYPMTLMKETRVAGIRIIDPSTAELSLGFVPLHGPKKWVQPNDETIEQDVDVPFIGNFSF